MAMATLTQSSPALTVSRDVPPTQNTAPVLEFRCMYTSDLRRKQKRWQDGRLKFHTFNRRVMVYDERSNFVGDTHWRKDYQFDDGEELELERGGILVEVGECIGKRDQDLTELVDKRIKEREERAAAKNAASPIRPQAPLNRPQTPAGSALPRPKSLNAVLGNPSGHYGKAVIPNQSPFEQRQQATRDVNENERPAKRRKQDDTPPSKSGYAQSLMGTKLTLASSRPPSTASIRYEPLRPNIQRTPVATIDLTWDKDDQRITGRAHTITVEEKTLPRPQRQRPNKSPPARSGYASSLTGASLTLNKPQSFTLTRSVRGLSKSTKGVHGAEGTGSSSSVEPDSLMEDESLEEEPAKRIQKHQKLVKKKTKSQLPDRPITPRSSSPREVHRPLTLWKSSVKRQDLVTQDFPASRAITDKPVSTLRIKSRAPRKMMILMDRPISRPPASRESSDNTQIRSRNLHNPKPGPENIVLSQATVRLDAFREPQEWRLQKRLNRERRDNHQDDLSSSPLNSGISDQMTDSFLSRRFKQSERVPPAAPVDYTLNQENAPDDEAAQVQKLGPRVNAVDIDKRSDTVSPELSGNSDFETHRPDNAEPNTRESSHQQPSSVPKVLPPSTVSADATNSMIAPSSDAQKLRRPPLPSTSKVLPEPPILSTDATGNMKELPSDVTEKRANESVEKTRSEESSPEEDSGLECLPPMANEPEQVLKAIRLENMASIVGPVFPQSETTSSRLGNPDAANTGISPQSRPLTAKRDGATVESLSSFSSNSGAVGDVETAPPIPDMESKIPKNSPVAQQRTPPLPVHFTSAMTAATDHFRAIIKSSASPSNEMIQDAPSPRLEQLSIPPTLVSCARKHEDASSDVVIKASPKPSPPITEVLDDETQREMAVESTIGKDNLSNPVLPIVPNARIAQPKPKLVNPATRGPSVQMTASRTVNALLPAFSPIPNTPPPLPRISIRLGRTMSQGESSRMRVPIKEVAPGGPWSRESFDLFGLWRPPGRDTDTSSVNG